MVSPAPVVSHPASATEAASSADVARMFGEVAQHASHLLAEHIEREIKRGIQPPSDEMGVAQAFLDMMNKLFADPYRLAQNQMNLVWDYFSLWQHSLQRLWGLSPEPVAAPAEDDRRFRDEDWQAHFLYDFIKQSYLITARHIHDTVCCIEGLDAESQQKVNFFTRQYIDAVAPSNFALTNPEVFRETLHSHGQNLIRGFRNLLRDMEAGDGTLRIRMTDPEAFELGRNVATTPGKVVFQNELMQLLQYAPSTATVFARPLLIVPPWINKYYVLDLREKNSFIKWAVDQGHSVFVISWVNPDARLAAKGFDNYLSEGVLAAVDAVVEQTGAKEINAVGYCLGGTLLAIALAWMAARHDKRVASGTFLASLLDFAHPGELGVFIDEAQVRNLEHKMAARGYLEGSEMAVTFNLLRANDLIWSFVVSNYLLGKDSFPFDLLYWNSDSTRLPARMHSFYLRKMYLENALRKPGGIELCGVKIDLGKIKLPCYFISTVEDHIAPWQSTYQGARCLGQPPRFVLGGSGHIAGIVNPPAANKYGFWAREDAALPASPEEWRAGAVHHEGSWWTDWQTWLVALEASRCAARDPAAGPLPVLGDAPGDYVRLRLDKSSR